MSKKEKDVEITQLPNGKWQVKHGNNSGHDEPSYPVLDYAQNSGPHLIVFKLSGNASFSGSDPIWVSDQAKPTSQTDHPQIADWVVLDGGKTLVALNKNSDAGTLYYNLNMQRPNGSTVQLDPVITNGGGTSGITSAEYAVAGAVAGALLALAVARFALGWTASKARSEARR